MYNGSGNQWSKQDQSHQGQDFLDQEVSFEQRETAPNGISNETMGEQALNSVEGFMAGNLGGEQELFTTTELSPVEDNEEKAEQKVVFSNNKEFTVSDMKKIEKEIKKDSVNDPANFYNNIRSNMHPDYMNAKMDYKIGEQE